MAAERPPLGDPEAPASPQLDGYRTVVEPPTEPAGEPPERAPARHPLVAVPSALAAFVGGWLVLSSFVFSSGEGTFDWTAVVGGTLVGVLGLARVGAPGAAWLSWATAAVGAGVAAAAIWLTEQTGAATWNARVSGGLIVVLAIAAALAGRRPARR